MTEQEEKKCLEGLSVCFTASKRSRKKHGKEEAGQIAAATEWEDITRKAWEYLTIHEKRTSLFIQKWKGEELIAEYRFKTSKEKINEANAAIREALDEMEEMSQYREPKEQRPQRRKAARKELRA